jgi:hypothetical protein
MLELGGVPRVLQATLEIAMNGVSTMVEQRVLESEARLRHIDELMAGLRRGSLEGRVEPHTANVDRIQMSRDRLARELEGLRGLQHDDGPEVAGRTQGLINALEAIGLELEKALASVFVARTTDQRAGNAPPATALPPRFTPPT